MLALNVVYKKEGWCLDMVNTRDINVEKEFKGLKFSMCILPIDDGYGGIDFEFSISGDIFLWLR